MRVNCLLARIRPEHQGLKKKNAHAMRACACVLFVSACVHLRRGMIKCVPEGSQLASALALAHMGIRARASVYIHVCAAHCTHIPVDMHAVISAE